MTQQARLLMNTYALWYNDGHTMWSQYMRSARHATHDTYSDRRGVFLNAARVGRRGPILTRRWQDT